MRQIDGDRLKQVFHKNIAGGEAYDDLIDMQPPITEVYTKDDMVAMLTEIQLEIHELWDNDPSYIEGVYDAEKIIRQKINTLNGE